MSWPNKKAAEEARVLDEHIENGRIVEALAMLRKLKPAAQSDARARELEAKLKSVEHMFAQMDNAPWGKPKGKEETLLMWHLCVGRVHHFKAQIKLDVPPMDLLVILREWDLVPMWNGKNVPKAIILEEPNLVSLRGAAELYIPPPFSNRSVVFDAEGFDLLDSQGVIAVDFSSSTASMAAMPKELNHLQHVLFEKPSGVRITPLTTQTSAQPGKAVTADRCVITWMLALDPVSLPVPTWLVDFVMTVIAPFVYKELVKVVTSIKGEYAARRRQRDKLYGALGARCDQHVARQLLLKSEQLQPERANSETTLVVQNGQKASFFSSFSFRSKSQPPAPHHSVTS